MSKQLTVTLYVDPATAARAGRSLVGETSLSLTDADLTSMTDDERDTLARHIAKDEGWGEDLSRCDAPPIPEATVATLRLLLGIRRAREEDRQRKRDERCAEADARILVALAIATAPVVKEEDVLLTERGDTTSWESSAVMPERVKLVWTTVPEVSYDDRLRASPEVRARYEARVERDREGKAQALARLVERELPRLRKAREERDAELARRVEDDRANLRQLLTDRDPDLVEVWAAGRADEKRIEGVLKAWLRDRLGEIHTGETRPLPKVEPPLAAERGLYFTSSEYTGSLDPDQYRALKKLEGSGTQLETESRYARDVSIDCVRSYSFRSAEEDEEGDEDGDSRIEGSVCARVCATVAGRQIQIFTPLV